jgi:hypothetical protein
MRREQSALLFAAATHGALLLALEAIPAPARSARRAMEEKSLEFDLEVTVPPESTPPARVPPPSTDPEGSRRPEARAEPTRGGAKPTADSVESTPEPLSGESLAQALSGPVVDPANTGPPGFRARASSFDVLAGPVGANPFLAALPGAPREGEAAGARGENEAVHTVRAELRDRDRERGLGASGPVVVAVEEIARTSTASVESHAVLDVVANAEGEITSVAVSSASEDRAGWDEVAKKLLASFRARTKRLRVRVPRGSGGLAMTIAVDSREALPSGAAPGANVELFDQRIARGKNERSNGVAILPLAKIPISLPVPGKPGVTQTTTVVLPVPLPAISGTFDVSDIGAPAARVVHAHATNEREL